MNNKHQELIAEAVKDIAIKMVNGVENKTDILTQTLQDTIDTVVTEERERAGEYMTPENGAAYLQALDKTPPNKV